MLDEHYMNIALILAEKGCGWVSPNPMVGAVIVKDGRIIGEGYHERYGNPHAERNALANCRESPQNATLYVTLEPCCHTGKTPPCTEAIIESGIRRVVIGSGDPNPLVAGQGIKLLRNAGIEVIEGVLEEECAALNTVFFHHIQTGLPYVVMKYAMTMDGKIAAYTGASKWITGELSRRNVQQDRHRYMAIMVGVGTVLADDPMLTCRLDDGRNPTRIICDTHLRTPLDSQIVKTAKDVPTIIATAESDRQKRKAFETAGCQIVHLPEKDNHVDLSQLMQILGDQKIDSVYLEGGGTLNWSALNAGIVNKVKTYIAPKLFGGQTAQTPVSGQGVPSPGEAFMLTDVKVTSLGDDILVESTMRNKPKSKAESEVN